MPSDSPPPRATFRFFASVLAVALAAGCSSSSSSGGSQPTATTGGSGGASGSATAAGAGGTSAAGAGGMAGGGGMSCDAVPNAVGFCEMSPCACAASATKCNEVCYDPSAPPWPGGQGGMSGSGGAGGAPTCLAPVYLPWSYLGFSVTPGSGPDMKNGKCCYQGCVHP